MEAPAPKPQAVPSASCSPLPLPLLCLRDAKSRRTAAGFSFSCRLCGHCFFPALPSLQSQCCKAGSFDPHSLWHCGHPHPNSALAMKMSPPNDSLCQGAGLALSSFPGATALRGSWVHPSSSSEQPWEVGESSCLERRQGQLITKHPHRMPPALLSCSICSCVPAARMEVALLHERETHSAPWSQHKAPHKEGLIHNQPVSRAPLQ